MLKRKMMDQLIEWEHKPNKKSLLITGARQIGKTFIVKEFAKKEYGENVVYINFEKEPDAKSFFSSSLDSEAIINSIKFKPKYSKIDFSKKTLFILDEIQSCPEAITALKFFTEAKCDVIGTGSLLGVGLKRVSSFPVGYIERLEMLPLDFEEFLWACNIDNTQNLKTLINTEENVLETIHNDYMRLFKEYMIIGGMPEVVNAYINKTPYSDILSLQRGIVQDYRDDIAKYADNNTKEKAKACFESIPYQLAKENKKFQFNLVAKGARSRSHDESINWLIDAGLVYKCNCITALELPLKAYVDPDVFKLYIFDTGLLVAMLDDGTADMIINGDLKIYKGAIYENAVANILNSIKFPLLYYKKDNRWELDFIISMNGEVIPIEVKSSENTKSKSLNHLVDTNQINLSFKVSSLNRLDFTKTKHMPLYLLPYIKQYTKK